MSEIDVAADVLRAGGLVVFPTETVYGLGAVCTDDKAVAGIYELKGRPTFNPLISHVDSVEMAEEYVEVTPLARRLMAEFCPDRKCSKWSFRNTWNCFNYWFCIRTFTNSKSSIWKSKFRTCRVDTAMATSTSRAPSRRCRYVRARMYPCVRSPKAATSS